MVPYSGKIEKALSRELSLYAHSRFYGPLAYAVEGGKRIRPVVLACELMLSMSGRRVRMRICPAADGQLQRRAQDRAKQAAWLLLKRERQWWCLHNEDGIMRCLS